MAEDTVVRKGSSLSAICASTFWQLWRRIAGWTVGTTHAPGAHSKFVAHWATLAAPDDKRLALIPSLSPIGRHWRIAGWTVDKTHAPAIRSTDVADSATLAADCGVDSRHNSRTWRSFQVCPRFGDIRSTDVPHWGKLAIKLTHLPFIPLMSPIWRHGRAHPKLQN
jgi:hypothetical protein